MFPHPWVVKTIKERVFFPSSKRQSQSLFVFGSSIIAGGQCNCTEPIFWFSTSTMLEKQSGLSHSDLVYCSTHSVLFQMMWSETQDNVQFFSKAKSGGSFCPPCQIIVFVCVCVIELYVCRAHPHCWGLHNRKITPDFLFFFSLINSFLPLYLTILLRFLSFSFIYEILKNYELKPQLVVSCSSMLQIELIRYRVKISILHSLNSY